MNTVSIQGTDCVGQPVCCKLGCKFTYVWTHLCVFNTQATVCSFLLYSKVIRKDPAVAWEP